MSNQQEKFIKVLEEMFQFDQADLDFGIYRIMNQKREEVTRFLEVELVPQVKMAFEKYKNADVETIKEEISKLEKQLSEMGVAKESSEKYLSLQNKLKKGVDVETLENEVYSDLTNFFKRYYHEGDFLTLRRYKKNLYAIPYEGEEVKLHWANSDQYYVKSSENFIDYSFTLPSGKKVHFKLVEASIESNNNKAQEGKERRFILSNEDYLVEENNQLIIRFEYRFDNENRKREKINDETIDKVFLSLKNVDWINELKTLAPTEQNKSRTILEKHLNDYTAKNSFDYFIHKDLGVFLKRELDFYIKNELVHLDDLDTENEKRFEEYLSKVKVIKSIGNKIIEFLSQIENFQKKLWLKKKFVIETNWCITIDRISEEFYDEILSNDAQRKEWVEMYAINEILEDLTTVGYSEPLTIEFLKQNCKLVVDTKHFSEEFKRNLIASFENIEDETNGVLIQSENFQALNLIREKYKNKVKCAYIDPPYNTNAVPINYKNNYKDSSWLSLMDSRLRLGNELLNKEEGYYSIAIDDYELHNLQKLIDSIFVNHDVFQVIVNHYPGSGTGRTNVSRTHEYNIFVIPEGEDILRGDEKEGGLRERGFCRSGTGDNNYRIGRPNSFYAVLVDEDTLEIMGFEKPPKLEDNDYPRENNQDGYRRIYPLGEDGSERCWSLSYDSAIEALENKQLICTKNLVIKRIYFDENERSLLPSLWIDKKFSAVANGTNLLTNIFGKSGLFSFPKSLFTVQAAIESGTYNKKDSIVLDFFAGSGTTGHAVINLNREDEGDRKYILVEMGEYFNTVTKPRIQKVIYSKEWKNGKPVNRDGISHIFKYIRLESYEDSLNNIQLKRTEQQEMALEAMSNNSKEEYFLSYMLDIEADGSNSLLNNDKFKNPFEYKMKISNGAETKIQNVDVIETFNYLLGINVKEMDFIRGYQLIKGQLGTGENVLIIWRNLLEKTNDDLEDFLRTLDISSKDFEYNRIYVNGDNHIENLKIDESNWKVVLIEEEFKRLMFDVQDV